MTPMSHNNNQHCKISKRWLECHSNVGGNQQLSKLELRPSQWEGKSYLVLEIQPASWANEFMDLKRGSTTAILLY